MKENDRIIGENFPLKEWSDERPETIMRNGREIKLSLIPKSKTTWRDRLALFSAGIALSTIVAADSHVSDEPHDVNSIISPSIIADDSESGEAIGSFSIVPIANGGELQKMEQFHEERSEDGLTDIERRDMTLDSYLEQRSAFIEYARYELFTDGSHEALSEVKQERYESVIFGINILQNYLGRADIEIDAKAGSVIMPGSRPYNLGSTTDLVILDQIIQYEIRDFKERPAERGERTNDILWLANKRGLDIEVEEDALAFLRNDGMLNLSRILQKIDFLGYPLPQEIDYVQQFGHGNAVGKYLSSDEKILLTGDEGSGTSVHEIGHHQSYENEDFSQSKYDMTITGIEDEVMAQGMVTGLSKFTVEYGKTNNKEDYATVFEWYFTKGKEFRDKIKTEFLAQSPEYKFLVRKYEFMKELFQGGEFLYEGKAFHPEIGDVFSISKPVSLQKGIILRSAPDFEADPLSGKDPIAVIVDGERVRILNASEEIINPDTELTTKMYLIMKENGQTGWIDGLILGDLLEQAGIGPQLN